MPFNPPTACAKCGQAKPCSCKPVPAFSNTNQYKQDDEISHAYTLAPWRKFSKLLRDLNPICQNVIGGVQCRYPSQLVHHLISPRSNRALFLSAGNCVAVCRGCHNNDEGEMRGSLFTPTKWILGGRYEHQPTAITESGEPALGSPEWQKAYWAKKAATPI